MRSKSDIVLAIEAIELRNLRLEHENQRLKKKVNRLVLRLRQREGTRNGRQSRSSRRGTTPLPSACEGEVET